MENKFLTTWMSRIWNVIIQLAESLVLESASPSCYQEVRRSLRLKGKIDKPEASLGINGWDNFSNIPEAEQNGIKYRTYVLPMNGEEFNPTANQSSWNAKASSEARPNCAGVYKYPSLHRIVNYY
jgi:hypothetical protein